MKRETKLRKKLNKTSFQSQLFFIILVSFILFELGAYLTISYTINNRYINTSLESNVEEFLEFKNNINRQDKPLINNLNDYKNKTGYTVLLLNSSSGSYVLEDYKYSSYSIVGDNGTRYIVPSFDTVINEGDSLSVYYKAGDSNKQLRKIVKGNKTIYTEDYISLEKEDIIVDKVEKPTNLNYLYLSDEETSTALNVLEKSYTLFSDVELDGATLKYYTDETNRNFYYLFVPNNLKDLSSSNSIIYVIAPITETKLLANVTSVTFIIIVIISLAIAILIAIFISNAFSNPIKLFEKEMRKLKENNYSKSDYKFRNKEMISLESTLNEVKDSVSEGVESINKQRRDLEKLNKKLLSEEELRASFVQRLSHELKTPLMIIGATTEALESGLIEKNNEKQSYETILNEVDKTTEIIKEIINNYKTIVKKDSLIKETFNLNELVLEVINPMLPLAKANDLNVITSLDDSCYMKANKEMIKNVISNFITNAIKYTPKGETIEVNIKEFKTSFTFEVINHGAHIDENSLEKIWLPFYREREDVDDSSTGMGLYIVKTTLESHNLDYDVSNIDGGVRASFVIKK